MKIQKRTFDILHFALGFKPKEKGIEEEKKGCWLIIGVLIVKPKKERALFIRLMFVFDLVFWKKDKPKPEKAKKAELFNFYAETQHPLSTTL